MSVLMIIKESELDSVLQELKEEIIKNDILIKIKTDKDFDEFIKMNHTETS